MNKQIFDTNFLLGLHLLLRQIDLSIDRSFNSSWDKMVSFFSDRGAITAVLEKLKSITTIGANKVTIEGSKHLGVSSLFVSHKNFLSEDEITFIFQRLETFDNFLLLENEPTRDRLVKLRMEVAFAEEFLKSRIDKKKLKGIEYVEHFNQNENLGCKSIDDLVGSAWF